jgi:hypothetical protein
VILCCTSVGVIYKEAVSILTLADLPFAKFQLKKNEAARDMRKSNLKWGG